MWFFPEIVEFIQRQFHPPVTKLQIVFDLLFGIVAPILCLIFDPFLFTGPAGHHISRFAYLVVALSFIALLFSLFSRRPNAFLIGALSAAAAFALGVGLLILPLAVVGTMVLIGIPGYTPLLTAIVYWRNVRRIAAVAQRPFAMRGYLIAFLGAVLLLGVPLVTQLALNRFEDRAVRMIEYGSDEQVAQATRNLQRLHVGTEEIAMNYYRADDDNHRQRLAAAYLKITGRTLPEPVPD